VHDMQVAKYRRAKMAGSTAAIVGAPTAAV
jgi:hypothetical protein